MMAGRWGGHGLVDGSFGFGGVIAMTIQLIFWIAIIIVAFKFLKNYFPHKQYNVKPEDQALEILRQRYAKGEIDTEEFNLRKKELENINRN